MTRRVLIAEPNADIRNLLELMVRRLGYDAVPADERGHVDVMLLEPACEVSRAVLHEYGADAPPVICLSIYPREDGLEPPASVAYLTKPCSTGTIADALQTLFGDKPAH